MCAASMGLYIRGGHSLGRIRYGYDDDHSKGFKNEVEYRRLEDSDEYGKKKLYTYR